MMMGVMGFGNYKTEAFFSVDPYTTEAEIIANNGDLSAAETELRENNEYPGSEYIQCDQFIMTFLAVFRMALGDNDMGPVYYMNASNHAMFWIVWMCISVICQIFLLNFIIAELSNSYQVVKDNYDVIAVNQQCGLIAETDDMLCSCFKN